MVTILRWILLIPVVVGSGYGIASLAIAYYRRLTAPCTYSPDLPLCTEPWYLAQWFWLPLVASIAVAIAVVLLAYLVAPSRKMLVAKLLFGAGAACAAYLEIFLGLLFQVWHIAAAGAAAIAAGFTTLALVARSHKAAMQEVRAHDA
jgi:hypothetical protein